jgi:outer membrane protein assembly factor BamA
MNKVTLLLLLLPLSLSLTTPVAAQKSPIARKSSVSASKLIGLKVTGTTRYNNKEILAATGLQIGQFVAEGDFKEAVQRLGDSGFFTDLEYTYSSSDAGVKLELKLTDTDPSKLVPAHFENFVWFTDNELSTALEQRVPLFKRSMPLTGNLPDRVSETLQAMLSEKRVPGHVAYLREGDETGGPLIGIAYRVEEVNIRIHAIEFPGATPEHAALLATAARRDIGGVYERTALVAVAKFNLMPVYQQRGYLKAEFGAPDAHVLPPPAAGADQHSPADIEVDAIVPVKPGQQYAISTVDWKGNSAIPTAEVAPLLHLAPGLPADAVRLLRDIDNVSKLYRSRGFMAVKVKPDAQFDDAKSSVHYDINIVEGDLYKMGEFEILGLDTQAKARMEEAWTLHVGQPYNADYPKKFLDDTKQLVPRGVQWAVSIHETPDARDKTVDVEIRFKQQ